MERNATAVITALAYLAFGHLLAMLVTIAPFALLASFALWQRTIQTGASILVAGFGATLLLWRKHPKVLSRIPPSQIGLWSFAVAIAHGAALMLVPIYLGLCRPADTDAGHQAVASLMGGRLATGLIVSLAHTLAMVVAGGTVAWLVYRYFGLRLLSQAWLNLDVVWSLSLIIVGTISLAANVAA
jgi:hypothetical protein